MSNGAVCHPDPMSAIRLLHYGRGFHAEKNYDRFEAFVKKNGGTGASPKAGIGSLPQSGYDDLITYAGPIGISAKRTESN